MSRLIHLGQAPSMSEVFQDCRNMAEKSADLAICRTRYQGLWAIEGIGLASGT
jgi:hypothetical protein